jgi:hypothetical protein
MCGEFDLSTVADPAAGPVFSGESLQFLPKALNLLWAILYQALLNDPKIDDYAANDGQSLTKEASYS